MSLQGRTPPPGVRSIQSGVVFDAPAVIESTGALVYNGDLTSTTPVTQTGGVFSGSTSNATVNGVTTVNSAQFNTTFPTLPAGNLTVGSLTSRYIVGSGTPTLTLGVAWATGSTITSSTLTDLWGSFTGTAAANSTATGNSSAFTVTFSSALPSAPVSAFAYGASTNGTAGFWVKVGSLSTTSVTFNSVNNTRFISSAVYNFNYFIFL